MSDTSQHDEQPLPVSTGRRAVRSRDPGRPAAQAQPATGAGPATGAEAAARATGAGPATGAEAAARAAASTRIGIRELRQHASVYVDLAEKGYTIDITNRGRLVARLVPVLEAGSPLERLIAAGILEPAEEGGGAAGLEPYPAQAAGQPTASRVLGQRRQEQAG